MDIRTAKRILGEDVFREAASLYFHEQIMLIAKTVRDYNISPRAMMQFLQSFDPHVSAKDLQRINEELRKASKA